MSITKEQLKQNSHEMLTRIFKLAEDRISDAVEAEVLNREEFEDNLRPGRIVASVVLNYALRQYAPAELDRLPEGPLRKANNRFYHLKVGAKK